MRIDGESIQQVDMDFLRSDSLDCLPCEPFQPGVVLPNAMRGKLVNHLVVFNNYSANYMSFLLIFRSNKFGL